MACDAVETVHAMLQFEVFVQFFIGFYDNSEKYCDNPFLVASRYLTSPRGFGFDFITSLPWSYIDLNSYQVDSGFPIMRIYAFAIFHEHVLCFLYIPFITPARHSISLAVTILTDEGGTGFFFSLNISLHRD